MSTVIEFPRPRADSTGPRKTGTAGDVVIFPGVRIERGTFSLADRLLPSPRHDLDPAKPREVETV